MRRHSWIGDRKIAALALRLLDQPTDNIGPVAPFPLAFLLKESGVLIRHAEHHAFGEFCHGVLKPTQPMGRVGTRSKAAIVSTSPRV